MNNENIEILEQSVEEMIKILEQKYPDIRTKKYEKGDDTWTFKERMILGLSLEIAIAGYRD